MKSKENVKKKENKFRYCVKSTHLCSLVCKKYTLNNLRIALKKACMKHLLLLVCCLARDFPKYSHCSSKQFFIINLRQMPKVFVDTFNLSFIN